MCTAVSRAAADANLQELLIHLILTSGMDNNSGKVVNDLQVWRGI